MEMKTNTNKIKGKRKKNEKLRRKRKTEDNKGNNQKFKSEKITESLNSPKQDANSNELSSSKNAEVRLNFLKKTTKGPDCSKIATALQQTESLAFRRSKTKWRLCTCTWRYLENAFIGKRCTGVPGSGTLVDETRPPGHSGSTHLKKPTENELTMSQEDDLIPGVRGRIHRGWEETIEEYNKLDAEDESLAKWKASLGLRPIQLHTRSEAGDKRTVVSCGDGFVSPRGPFCCQTLSFHWRTRAVKPLDKQITFNIKEKAVELKIKFRVSTRSSQAWSTCIRSRSPESVWISWKSLWVHTRPTPRKAVLRKDFWSCRGSFWASWLAVRTRLWRNLWTMTRLCTCLSHGRSRSPSRMYSWGFNFRNFEM